MPFGNVHFTNNIKQLKYKEHIKGSVCFINKTLSRTCNKFFKVILII